MQYSNSPPFFLSRFLSSAVPADPGGVGNETGTGAEAEDQFAHHDDGHTLFQTGDLFQTLRALREHMFGVIEKLLAFHALLCGGELILEITEDQVMILQTFSGNSQAASANYPLQLFANGIESHFLNDF